MNEKASQEEASPFWIEPQRLAQLIARVEAPCGTLPDAAAGVGSVTARLYEETSPPAKVEAPQVEAPQVEAPQVEEPQVEAPQVEAPQVPALQVPGLQVPALQVPEPQVPEPQVPAPQVPALQIPKATTVKPWHVRAVVPVPYSPSKGTPKIDLDETVTVLPSTSSPDTEPPAEKSSSDAVSENVPPPYQVGTGPIEERLEGLLAWLAAHVAPRQAFVTDREGLALAGDAAAATVAAAAEMAGTWEKLRAIAHFPEDGTLSVDTSDGACLHLLRAATPWGILHLGFIAERLIPTATLGRIHDAFVSCVDEKERR